MDILGARLYRISIISVTQNVLHPYEKSVIEQSKRADENFHSKYYTGKCARDRKIFRIKFLNERLC